MDLKKEIAVIEKTDERYPSQWKDLSDAPERLYALGDADLLKEKRILTIVGSRQTPVNALKLTKQIARTLSEVCVIATGTALGGDSATIEGAMDGNGKVICLLAGGLNHIPQNNLPLIKEVAKRGLVLALHSPETPVREFSYDYRNKFLAKLSVATLIVGAPEKSGTRITADYAKSFGKKIFAFPYFAGTYAGEGCNAGINQGAVLPDGADVVQNDLGGERAEKIDTPMTADEKTLYESLKISGEEHISALCQRTGMPIFKARAILSSLEIKGLAVAVGGNRYAPL